MFPESELIKETFTVRRMAELGSSGLTRRSLVRWFALSLGLLNPNDKRETIVDILDMVFARNFRDAKPVTISDLVSSGIPQKTAYYHMKRLKDQGLLERRGEGYFWINDFDGIPSLDVFQRNVIDAINLSQRALREISRLYSQKGK